MGKKIFIILVGISLTPWVRRFSQEHYFYGSVKVAVADYIKFITDKNTDENYKTDGAIFSFGYGKLFPNNLGLETGLQTFASNPIYERYNLTNNNYNEVIGKNQAFFLQLSAFYKIDLSETDFLRFGSSVNFGKLFSKVNYYENSVNNSQVYSKQLGTFTSKSNFLLKIHPFIGATFSLTDKLAIGFDIEYININWDKSMRFLNLAPLLGTPTQKTDNIFLSGRILFK
ncbi:outer membrane beta-barrel protein [Pedobacter sandarakinus]|uniref:outer membrane beta-barrel protein n=1 Tax=Pedobacter sandarakinus TaxID=353156 RepID=UPI0022451E86|nr:outer membrane beta-barrel protein [Pedobacter sandarakinus]MCX2575835.1 hypothetical protein [Pedobacter sandarakinus]